VVAVQMQAACDGATASLSDAVRRAPVVVVALALREQLDSAAGYATTLRLESVLKGRSTTPVITLYGLGHLGGDCSGGPRLQRGGRYVLFLEASGQDPSVVWSLFDGDGGVYQLVQGGVRFPPEHAGGQPQLVAVAPAEFVRDVGVTLLGDAPSRIDALVSQDALSESVDTPQPPEKPWYDRLPRRETAIAVAGAAAMFAGLIFLLWRPGEPKSYRRS
jgi:hypothetical protein